MRELNSKRNAGRNVWNSNTRVSNGCSRHAVPAVTNVPRYTAVHVISLLKCLTYDCLVTLLFSSFPRFFLYVLFTQYNAHVWNRTIVTAECTSLLTRCCLVTLLAALPKFFYSMYEWNMYATGLLFRQISLHFAAFSSNSLSGS